VNPLAGRILWKYQKNRALLDALLWRRGPDFIVNGDPPAALPHIPVFTFHVPIPERFELQCRFLAENGYRTLDSDELSAAMLEGRRPAERSVVITFDDGLKQVWTVAYPILRKYGLKAIVFLVPGCIDRDPDIAPRPTLEDAWQGRADVAGTLAFHGGESPLATWQEVRLMHESGVVDFQSHTMWHSLVPHSTDVIDFGHPDYDRYYFGNIHVPVYQRNGSDVTSRTVLLGMPIYASAPRMQVAARYYGDEGMLEHCVETVSRGGGANFFEDSGWRKTLTAAVAAYREQHGRTGRYETPVERDAAIAAELLAAREAIESRLVGKTVRHLCFPWYKGAEFAERCAYETGHALTYYDSTPGFWINRVGGGPRIARVDETFLRRLPGAGRLSRTGVLAEVVALRDLGRRMFPGGYTGSTLEDSSRH
jgi:hypothetical protein